MALGAGRGKERPPPQALLQGLLPRLRPEGCGLLSSGQQSADSAAEGKDAMQRGEGGRCEAVGELSVTAPCHWTGGCATEADGEVTWAPGENLSDVGLRRQ